MVNISLSRALSSASIGSRSTNSALSLDWKSPDLSHT
ncbi:Uncharacterised protein [Vibrio cholerae]|nr:Uncharacterised protein [Vibrio cholerae]